MKQDGVEVVRVGDSGNCILRISRKQIEYIGTAGNECTIDLEECARNWMRSHFDHEQDFVPVVDSQGEIDSWNARCIGERGALDDPPWVEFQNDRKTRFEFRSYEALYGELARSSDAEWLAHIRH